MRPVNLTDCLLFPLYVFVVICTSLVQGVSEIFIILRILLTKISIHCRKRLYLTFDAIDVFVLLNQRDNKADTQRGDDAQQNKFHDEKRG